VARPEEPNPMLEERAEGRGGVLGDSEPFSIS